MKIRHRRPETLQEDPVREGDASDPTDMEFPTSKTLVAVGGQTVALPEGVNAAQWALERVRWQNPRIRAFLGCSRLLDEVLESNYAILHCSPDRLLEIWNKVRKVSEVIRIKIAPLLSEPSCIPQLELAREAAQQALGLLSQSVLQDFDRYPAEDIPSEEMLSFRKLLCVSIGQIHSFLQDTFGELMAADPRSQHNADYFLSRRFPQDIEEAEWLHLTVERLESFLSGLQEEREKHLSELGRSMRRSEVLPSPNQWKVTRIFLERMITDLTPRLREVLALRGIRFSEMEILDRYATQLPTQCQLVIELYDVGYETGLRLRRDSDQNAQAQHEQAIRDMMLCHSAFSQRIVKLLGQIDHSLSDLSTFVPLWREGVEKRRALMLHRQPGDHPQSDANIDAAFSQAIPR